MKMTELMPAEGWAELERQLHQRFNLNARAYDDKGFTFTGSLTWCNPLCPAIKARPQGLSAICSVANQAMTAEARQSRDAVVEACDAGLVKICVPVMADGQLAGIVSVCGGLAPGDEVDAFLVHKAAGLEEVEVGRLAAQVPAITRERIDEIVVFIKDKVAGILASAK